MSPIRMARGAVLLWVDLCTTQAYLLATAIVAVALRLSFNLQDLYRSEPCTGILHHIGYRIEPWLSPWSSYWW